MKLLFRIKQLRKSCMMLIMVWFSLRRNPRNQKSIKPFLQLKFQTDMVIKNGVPNVHSTKPCSTSMSHSLGTQGG
ncbi:hypothetical protein MtrunA17_Chr7g0214421 [Medicago truncatula]|uniref:Uncharacterized protein n=1 Tax=Medicago truncatula TaxID=3880 RepID=A0A396GTW3_MEDTR|nr:hypothetical protein MtrunA17_Chr7g0214421 [Medicago truncatula]